MLDNDYEIEQEERESAPIARCAECGQLIYEESIDAHVDGDKNYFCSLECTLRFYNINRIEE